MILPCWVTGPRLEKNIPRRVNAKNPFQIVFTDRGGLGFEAFEGQETIKDQAQSFRAICTLEGRHFAISSDGLIHDSLATIDATEKETRIP
jgi:hypothetical protein